jgi:hypothetical protein
LDIKDKAEQLKRAELLQLGEQLAEAHALLRAQERLLQTTLERVFQMDRSVRMQAQALAMKQSAHNDRRLKIWRERIAQLERQKEAKTAEVMTLRREREGLERLRSQALEEYQTEYDRDVQKESDDRVSMRYVREQQGQMACCPAGAPADEGRGDTQ